MRALDAGLGKQHLDVAQGVARRRAAARMARCVGHVQCSKGKEDLNNYSHWVVREP